MFGACRHWPETMLGEPRTFFLVGVTNGEQETKIIGASGKVGRSGLGAAGEGERMNSGFHKVALKT